jgi:hypothetical protein
LRCSDYIRFLAFDGMTMKSELYRIKLTRFAGRGGGLVGWKEKAAVRYLRPGYVFLPVLVIAAVGAWILLAGSASNTAESEPIRLAMATATEPTQLPVMAAREDTAQQDDAPVNIATTPAEALTPVETAPVDGLTISSQSWRRAGLGSKALVTFTLRNGNDYAVKDIELFCSFSRRDGSHVTDRRRTIPDTVNMKSRRTFARLHIGFVNINAEQAKCSLIAASHA